MDTLQCAVVLAKLDRFDWEIEQRIQAGAFYLDLLQDIASVQTLMVKPDRTCVWGQFTIQVENRDEIQADLKLEGVPTHVHYPTPLHLQPAYKNLHRISGSLEKSEKVAKRVLSLPMHPYIDHETQERIVGTVAKVVA
jgi:UDP-2-acetamido-2-deoxy-ribo-hexuluronate aminotransferase